MVAIMVNPVNLPTNNKTSVAELVLQLKMLRQF